MDVGAERYATAVDHRVCRRALLLQVRRRAQVPRAEVQGSDFEHYREDFTEVADSYRFQVLKYRAETSSTTPPSTEVYAEKFFTTEPDTYRYRFTQVPPTTLVLSATRRQQSSQRSSTGTSRRCRRRLCRLAEFLKL